jgi:hypothetical protein
MAGQIQDDDIVPAHQIGRFQGRRISGQLHNVIGQRGGYAVSINGFLARAMEIPALIIHEVKYHCRFGDDEAAAFPKLRWREHGYLVAGPFHLRMLNAHAALKQGRFWSEKILLGMDLGELIRGNFRFPCAARGQ